jgi:UDP:flavonoid glycosyltransferase YjiC (YdhE family)
MAKIWLVSAPLFSHTDWGGFLKTGQVLQARGHEVLWVSGERLRKTVEAQNIPFQAISETGWLWPPPPQPDLTNIPPQEAVNLRYKRALDTWLSEDIVGAATQALIDLAADIGKPDSIVTDPFLSASALAAEALNVPMVVAGWPAQGDLNFNNLFPVQRDLSSDSQQRIQRLLEQFGLNGENFSKGPTPSILSPHLHICYFTRDWYSAESDTLLPQNIFVGGRPSPAQGEPPKWLTDIPQGVPLALVTLGTTFTGDMGFFSWGAQAAARQHLLPIVVIGYNPFSTEKKQELIVALPKGSRLLNFVPFEHVLPRTRLMIHHGGMGTTHYATVYGIPQIVVPHAADQRVQAKRVAHARIGLNLSAHDVRQGMLWEGTQALLEYEQMNGTARAFAERMIALGGPEEAATAIERVFSQ